MRLKQILAAACALTALSALAAPINPSLPNPPNLASNVPANIDLVWSPGDSELVVNGNFETGNFNGWTRLNPGGGGGGGTLNNSYINNGTYIPVDGDGPHLPYAGGFSSVTDQNGPGGIMLYQDVAIPANAASVVLTWADMIRNQFNTFVNTQPTQEYRVEIRRPDNVVLATVYRTEAGDPTITDWQKRSISLDAYKGQTIRITFIEEQFWSFFNLHLDNVSIRVRDSGPFTNHVYFGTTNVLNTNHFVGTTTNDSWILPQLNPQTTYFWRLISQQGSLQITGPVWRFTTAPVGQVARFVWDPIPSPHSPDAPVAVKLTAVDAANNIVSNFNGTANLTGASVTSSTTGDLLGAPSPSSFAAFDRSTVGYSFTPDRDLLVTGVRHYSGRKVSVWEDSGVLLGSKLVTGSPGIWRETPITPIQLLAGRTYRVGLYSPYYETNYLRLDGSEDFSHGVIHTSYEGLGDAFPTNGHSARWWFVDLVYSVRDLQPVVVTPNVTAAFSGGSWIGSITVGSGTSVLLRAEDQNNHVGLANLISIIDDTDGDGMPDDWESAYDLDPEDPSDALADLDGDGATNLAEYRAGTHPQDPASALRFVSVSHSPTQVRLRFSSMVGKSYTLLSSPSIEGPWQILRENIPGTGLVEEITHPATLGLQSFFRLRLAQ